MASLDLLSSGFAAVRQGQYRANTAAAEVARAGAPVEPTASQAIPLQPANGQPSATLSVDSNRPVNLINGLVDLQLAQREVEAGVAIIEAADDMLGTLIDVTV